MFKSATIEELQEVKQYGYWREGLTRKALYT